MKRISLSATAVLACTLLIGCKEKTPEAPQTPETSSSEPAKPSATEQVKDAVTKVTDQAVTEVKKQATEAAQQIQSQVKSAYNDLSQQLTASNQGTSNDLTKNITTDLQDKVQKLSESAKDDPSLTEKLSAGIKSLLGNKDGEAVSSLGGMSSAKLTPEQSTLAKEVYNAAAALVTERNFSSIEGMDTDVSKLATAVWKGNYSDALPPLQKLYSQATLTPDQKDLLGKMYDSYMPAGWKDSAAKLQQGLDTLKTKFGQ
ncbi:hypothetical protein GC207_08875 [bacterium]|nr:hypothetical protein [bacterium]